MKLEAGKTYSNEAGKRILIRLLDGDPGSAYPVMGNKLDTTSEDAVACWYSLTGSGYYTPDLIKEVIPRRRIAVPTYRWAAMDSDGRWFVYITKPDQQEGMWIEADEDEYNNIRLDGLAEGTYTGDWKDSLHTIEPDGTLTPYVE